jgi:CubicO group peptidase (beta-lactamase class C family)
MKICFRLLLVLPLSLSQALAQQSSEYDYFQANRIMIRNGAQALITCNGVFTSNRTLEQIFDQELAIVGETVGSARGGDYVVDSTGQTVAVGGDDSGPVMRAAFREGVGCVLMSPDQSFDDIDSLPALDLPYPDMDPATTPWPNGDLVEDNGLPPEVDAQALDAASDWAFSRPNPEQDTLSLIVVYKGDIIYERYADGVDMYTRTRTWSTAKSITATLVGMLVDEGRMSLDEPLGLEWLPEVRSPETDPRNAITLRHVLNMSTGLYPTDGSGPSMYAATGSGLAYWAGASSNEGARRRGLVREPGTYWDYENYDTLLAVIAMKKALGDDQTYFEFPRTRLFDKIGMRNTLAGTDRFGDFILSSQIYTNARDLARIGLLYLQGGVWDGERLLSEDWIEFVTTPAPASAPNGNNYGGQWWLVPDDRNDVPKSAFSTSGNRGQYVIVVPTHDIVIVRRGLDYGGQGFDRWGLLREVLKAIPESGDWIFRATD